MMSQQVMTSAGSVNVLVPVLSIPDRGGMHDDSLSIADSSQDPLEMSTSPYCTTLSSGRGWDPTLGPVSLPPMQQQQSQPPPQLLLLARPPGAHASPGLGAASPLVGMMQPAPGPRMALMPAVRQPPPPVPVPVQPNQSPLLPKKKTTQPCSMHCPGALGVPMLSCSRCHCMYHPKCVGLRAIDVHRVRNWESGAGNVAWSGPGSVL